VQHGNQTDAEARRLEEDARRVKHWNRWGPYMSERQSGQPTRNLTPIVQNWPARWDHDARRSDTPRSM
jgi:hypothetical protein